MKTSILHLLLLSTLVCACPVAARGDAAFTLLRGHAATVYCGPQEAEVVHTAVGLLQGDYATVFGATLAAASIDKADIVVGTVADAAFCRWATAQGVDLAALTGRHEAYTLRVVTARRSPRLVIAGSDKRGAAYGVMTLSERLGVSPWAWWADCPPQPTARFELPAGFVESDAPDVAYRGIFINDEDWGLTPWSSTNYEPRCRAEAGGDPAPRQGEIGPYTHARIFELMLRLRANTFWPAMHECSVPFYLVEGNKEMADRYGIIVSTSHCEPMMRNTNGEWRTAGRGEYNFITNRAEVTRFWEERVAALAGTSDCIYTLGIRGVHDSRMLGANTVAEQVAALTEVIATQRDMLARLVNADVTAVPQQFVPYKEVLDCYRAGLVVPDDVSLIWCDDNFGYIRHFPTADERRRSGGHGIYYHISYWGRPHDYLWLATTPPELVREEMLKAYDHGASRIWILNVGDIKPGEYLTSLFLDMAWDVEAFRADDALSRHLDAWYGRQLGLDGHRLASLWRDYYALSFAHRPEFAGGTRTEERDARYKRVSDLPLNAAEVTQRLATCRAIDEAVCRMTGEVPAAARDAWFQLVEYPLRAMAAMNVKHLGAQLARHDLGAWQVAEAAYDTILALTDRYNALGDGKWRGMMDCAPRQLPVFAPVVRDTAVGPMPRGTAGHVAYASPSPIGTPVAVGQPFACDAPAGSDSIRVEVRVLPVHPINERALRLRIGLEGDTPVEVNIRTTGRSEEWKRNVLLNYATRTVTLPAPSSRRRLTIDPVDETIYLQKVIVAPTK